MATTINGAFTQFRRDCVDLDPKQVVKARQSRDYLQKQIRALARNMPDFPELETEPPVFVSSGSFSRGTKIQPLDDIDFFVVMSLAELTYDHAFVDSRKYYVQTKLSFRKRPRTSALARLADDTGKVSSRRVLNRFKGTLATVPNYALADIKRNREAVSLQLPSYPWVFDIVPVVPVPHWFGWFTKEADCYLMPNGKGEWMRSDPRKDTASTMEANQKHNKLLLPTIRLIKYWNKNRLRQGLSSYYIETLCLKVFDSSLRITSIHGALATFFKQAPAWVRRGCPDPKGFGPHLDSGIDRDTKAKVIAAMKDAAQNAKQALRDERDGHLDNALDVWAKIFGPNFSAESHMRR